jgi:hypothetical protein
MAEYIKKLEKMAIVPGLLIPLNIIAGMVIRKPTALV